MMKIKFSEKSLAQMASNCQKIQTNTVAGAKRALKEVAGSIMAQSKAEVPYDTGTLQNSAYIEEPIEGVRNVYIKMGYGGPNDKRNPDTGKMASEYALVVHETPGTPPGGGNYHPYGKWKFLEDPVRRHVQAFMQMLAKELRVVLAPGVKVR